MTRIALYCAERSRPDAEAISDRIKALAPDMSVAVETFEACAGRNAIEIAHALGWFAPQSRVIRINASTGPQT